VLRNAQRFIHQPLAFIGRKDNNTEININKYESTPKSSKMLIFILFYPLPLKGKSKNQHFRKPPLGDLGVKGLFGVDSNINHKKEIRNETFTH